MMKKIAILLLSVLLFSCGDKDEPFEQPQAIGDLTTTGFTDGFTLDKFESFARIYDATDELTFYLKRKEGGNTVMLIFHTPPNSGKDITKYYTDGVVSETGNNPIIVQGNVIISSYSTNSITIQFKNTNIKGSKKTVTFNGTVKLPIR